LNRSSTGPSGIDEMLCSLMGSHTMNRSFALCHGPVPVVWGLAFSAIVGCGPSSGDVTGTVTLQGKTVRSGSVIVVASDLLTYNGNIQEDGSYMVPRVPTGLARIAVFSPAPYSGKSIKLPLPMGTPGFERTVTLPPSKVDPKNWFPLPDKYREFDESGLTVKVISGMNERDISLGD
jgi:hypothetical protein